MAGDSSLYCFGAAICIAVKTVVPAGVVRSKVCGNPTEAGFPLAFIFRQHRINTHGSLQGFVYACTWLDAAFLRQIFAAAENFHSVFDGNLS